MDESFSQEQATGTAFVSLDLRNILSALDAFARVHRAELVSGLLLAVMSLQMLVVISRKSITLDEIVMIPAAYYHLADGNFQLINEHPPISKIIAAVPLLFVQPEEARPEQISAAPDTRDAKLAYQDTFWSNNADRFDSLSFWPRVPMILLTVVLGLLIFRFARELFGTRIAVLAVALFSIEPTILAHGRVVQTDVPATLGYLLFFMALYRYLQKPDAGTSIWLGAATGIAILTKYSMLLVGPVLAVVFCILLLSAHRQNQNRGRIIVQAVLVLLAIILMVNVCYFFRHDSLVEADTQFLQANFPAHNQAALFTVKLLSYFLPKDFVLGIFFQFWHNAAGHPASLFGMHSDFGWWYYFPVAFALKTTIPFLLLSVVSIGWGTYQWIKNGDRRFAWLLGPFFIYTIFVLFSRIDIGVRYYLPAYPFLFILGAVLLERLAKLRTPLHAGALAAVALVFWMGIEAVRVYPDHMTYMNQLASRAPHWWYLSDSNVEWGDDLRSLAIYLQARGVTRIRDGTLGGFFLLHYYGIDRVDALSSNPSKELYTAVGAGYLNGSVVPRSTPEGRQLTEGERVDAFASYRNRVPEAVFGGSIFLFREDQR